MKHIVFDSADDLFNFIVARRALGGQRSQFCDTVCLGESDYRLNFEPSDWDGTGNTFGGRISEGKTPGRSLSVSELLEHVLLQRVSVQFNSGVGSIVLAIPVAGPSATMAAQQLLYEVWRQIERVEWARSAFHLCRAPAGGGWHAVQIDGLAPGFDFAAFRQAHRTKFERNGLRVLAPGWNSTGCRLFVEWEYRYPKATEFAQLHRESGTQLILCLAEREAKTREARRSWWVPAWHVLDGEIHYTVSDLFQLAPPSSISPVRYHADSAGGLTKVSLPLVLGPVAEAVASAGDLELRIGLLKRELESLTVKRERLDRATHQEFFAIYQWRQDADDGALPAGLEHLLGKPLSELNRYLYLQSRNADGSTIHYVAPKDHQSFGLAGAVVCDECYLCDSRWLSWRLPLFVRRGMALSIDINEEEMAAKISAVVPPPDDADREGAGESFCLVDSSPDPGVPAFTWLIFSGSLDTAFTLTNGRAAGPGVALRAAAYEAGGAASSQDVNVSAAALDLDCRTRERVEEQFRVLEDGWENARRDLQAAAFQLRLAELAIGPLSAARGALANSWSQFLERILEADVIAAKFKLEALGNWAASEPTRRARLRQHEEGLTDVATTIQTRRGEYASLMPRIEARNQALIAECAQLDQKLKEVLQEESKLDQQQQSLAAANAQLEIQIAALEGRIRVADQEAARNTALGEQLANCALRETEALSALEQSQDELRRALEAFRERLAAARGVEKRLASEYSAREDQARTDAGFFKSIFRKHFGDRSHSKKGRQ